MFTLLLSEAQEYAANMNDVILSMFDQRHAAECYVTVPEDQVEVWLEQGWELVDCD